MSKSAVFRFFLPTAIGSLVGVFFLLPIPWPDQCQEVIATLNGPGFILFWVFAFLFHTGGFAWLDCMCVLQWASVGSFVGTCWLFFGTVEGTRRHRGIAINIFASVCLVFVLLLVSVFTYGRATSIFLAFKHKSVNYHAEFAQACDSILAQHPLGTNQDIELSGSDPSLPKIIRETRPASIGISANHVCVLVKMSHINGLAVNWQPVWESDGPGQTRTWALTITTGEGPEDTVLITNRVP